MFNAMLIAVMMVMILSMGGGRGAKATSLDLSQYQWKNRLLFIFAPNRDHPLFETMQNSLRAQGTEVADRNLVIFEILESGRSNINMKHLDSQTAQSLRKKFTVPRNEFTVILIGKDGGIKLNHQDQIQLEDIFELIDAMPMRQEEIRQKGQ